MVIPGSTVIAAIATITGDIIAEAVAFGVPLDKTQQIATSALVGAVTVAVVGIIGWVETGKLGLKAAAVAAGVTEPAKLKAIVRAA